MKKVDPIPSTEFDSMSPPALALTEAKEPLFSFTDEIVSLQKKMLKQQKKQRLILTQLLEVQQQTSSRRLIDRVDICKMFGFGQTKFYRVKNLFTSYKLGGKEYYYEDEVHRVIQSWEQESES